MEKSFQESNLSGLGMGTWGIGEDASKKKDELAALRYGLDHGIKVIDTAEMYGEGKSEKLVGEAIKGYDRSKIFNFEILSISCFSRIRTAKFRKSLKG